VDSGATSTNQVVIGGTVTLTQAGSMYVPSGTVRFSGGVSATCTNVLAAQIDITGTNNALNYTSSCLNTGGGGCGGSGGSSSTIGFLE
jgi:hypothetical protein